MFSKEVFITLTEAGDFLSRVKTIRPKNLRNFLLLYYFTYVADEDIHLFAKVLKPIGARRPKIRPGVRFIMGVLGCSKGAAQDYLRAIQITHDIFLEDELERRRFLKRIDRKSYRELMREIAQDFENITKRLGVRITGLDPRAFRDLKASLYNVAAKIERTSGVFTAKDCAKIVRELASWFV